MVVSSRVCRQCHLCPFSPALAIRPQNHARYPETHVEADGIDWPPVMHASNAAETFGFVCRPPTSHPTQRAVAFHWSLRGLSVDTLAKTTGSVEENVCLHYVHSGSAGSRGSPLTQTVHSTPRVARGGLPCSRQLRFFLLSFSHVLRGGLFGNAWRLDAHQSRVTRCWKRLLSGTLFTPNLINYEEVNTNMAEFAPMAVCISPGYGQNVVYNL